MPPLWEEGYDRIWCEMQRKKEDENAQKYGTYTQDKEKDLTDTPWKPIWNAAKFSPGWPIGNLLGPLRWP